MSQAGILALSLKLAKRDATQVRECLYGKYRRRAAVLWVNTGRACDDRQTRAGADDPGSRARTRHTLCRRRSTGESDAGSTAPVMAGQFGEMNTHVETAEVIAAGGYVFGPDGASCSQ